MPIETEIRGDYNPCQVIHVPELPEVETVVRGLNSQIRGKTIEEITVFDEELLRNVEVGTLKEELEGKKVTDVRRRGKYVLLEIQGGKLTAIHLRMTGKLLVQERGEKTEYARISFLFRGDGKLVMDNMRRFGTLDLLASEDQEPLASLGPDPFTENYRWKEFRELFDRAQPLKLILLDQKKIAGLGNIYANEVLFRAGLNPFLPGKETEERDRRNLFELIPEVLSEAVESNGTTLDSFRNSRGEEGDYQNFLEVYGREGEPCPNCGTEIVKANQSGRSTCYCPKCQSLD